MVQRHCTYGESPNCHFKPESLYVKMKITDVDVSYVPCECTIDTIVKQTGKGVQ